MKSIYWVKEKVKYIKDNIESSIGWWRKNREYYAKAKEFISLTTIDASDRAILRQLKKPEISCNVSEKHVLRLLGEFNNQCPTIDVYFDPCAKNTDENLLDFIRCHFKVILNDVNLTDVFRDCLVGGFSAMKISNEYESYKTMRQKIVIEKIHNPLMVGFDPDAKERHKGDGGFVFEILPIKKSKLKIMYDKDILGQSLTEKDYSLCNLSCVSLNYYSSYNVNHKNSDDDISFICDFFSKESKSVNLFRLSDGSEMFESDYKNYLKSFENSQRIDVPLKVATRRKSYVTNIRHYRLLGDKILSTSVLPFKKLPIVFFDGNSDFYTKSSNDVYTTNQIVKSYLHNTFSIQKAKDQVFRTIVQQIENRPVGKWVIPIEGVTEEQMQQLNNIQSCTNILYKQFDDIGDGIGRELRPPTFIESPPIDQSAVAIFNSFDRSIDEVLGVYNQESSVNNGVVSGKAIIQGSLNSNSASKPFYQNFLVSFQRLADVALSGMSKIYIEKNRPIGIIDKENKSVNITTNPSDGRDGVNIDFDAEDIRISIKAGFNFEIQKNRDIETILKAASSVSGIANIVNQPVVSGKILENLAIGEISAPIKEAVDNIIQRQKQQEQMPQQPDLMQIKIQLEQQKLLLDKQKNEIAHMKIMLDHKVEMSKVQNEKEKIETNQISVLSDIEGTNKNMNLQKERLATERAVHHVSQKIEDKKLEHDVLKTVLSHKKKLKQQVNYEDNTNEDDKYINDDVTDENS